MPILRLRKHPATFSDEDVLINPSDYPDLKLNDVVELKLPKGGNANNRILLQVRRWPETNQNYPNSVSIKDSVFNNYLQLYADVQVSVVDKRDVLVDSIEICFSNTYLARSYMWGLRTHLNNRCVYQRQKLDYLHIRSQICEIWAQGSKVSSGYVDDDTKIVFRSASSLVYLFIQMSSEMWDYDINGDLYCEKAINGFLTDLFETWRQNDCSHDITIVLFSRTFYDAEKLDEFPKEMRECLQVDYRGRFYEDCYRVAFQNDRFDLHDWNAKLTTLKSLFNQYQKEVINRHKEKYNTRIPRAYNSSAAQGNFLEVLNMSLNVFEKHYFDRSFDRTGQLSVVVSPGVGVFEVDFEMTNLTKQRIIDNGIGSDLVCLGEQPLHTVPLLKFNSKSSQFDDNLATCDVYNMPHWINLSFYSSQNQVYYSNFVPRIKLPTLNTTSKQAPNRNDVNRVTLTENNGASNFASSMNSGLNRSSSTVDDHSQQATSSKDHHRYAANNLSAKSRINSGNTNYQNNYSSHYHHNHHTTMPDLVDYDEYDAQVFKANSMITYHCQQQQHTSARGTSAGADRSVLADMDPNVEYLSDIETDDNFMNERDNRLNKAPNIQRRSSDVKNYQEYSRNMRRQASENLPIVHQPANQLLLSSFASTTTTAAKSKALQMSDISSSQQAAGSQAAFARMSLVDSYLSEVKIKPESADDLSVRGYNAQSSRFNRSTNRPKALINPFDPSHMTIKLTPNRRRWTHVFPQGPTGTFIQQHHYQPTVAQKSSLPYLADVPPPVTIPENEPLHSNHQRKSLTHKGPLSNAAHHSQTGQDNVSVTGRVLHDNRQLGQLAAAFESKTKGILVRGVPSAASATATKSALVSNETIRFAWCASGEQEWTPAITTGVDWKSLTMPACLPLTTDFFPSKTSLQNDYVIGEYNIDSSCIHPRYTLIEVYRELVCQRLQKGFQIILLPRSANSSGARSSSSNTAGSLQQTSVSSSRNPLAGSSTMTANSNNHRNSSANSRASANSSAPHNSHSTFAFGISNSGALGDHDYERERERTEYTMSIGRIFHKLTLNGNTITVTQYRPRHPYPTIKIDYCYRFRAPFHETYGQSWVHFKSEKLENYSWNYLDNYICARGESYELRSSLKFWRFRLLVLPSKLYLSKLTHSSVSANNRAVCSNGQCATIRHAPTKSATPVEGAQQMALAEDGYCRATPVAFVESGSADDNGGESKACSPTTHRHDIFPLDYSDEERSSLMESFVKLLEIINKTRRASAARMSSASAGGSGVSGGANTIPQSATLSGPTPTPKTTSESVGDTPSELGANKRQQQQLSPTRLIVQIGSTPTAGLPRSAGEAGLFPSTPGALKSSSLTSTATGKQTNQSHDHNGSLATSAAEAEELMVTALELRSDSINMDIDSALRDAKRSEWIHVQYHNFYDIYQAFELVIKWMVASGAGIAEMVQGWSRKAGNSSVHLVPIPWESFAMPHSGKADPLRCPLVIELQLDCLDDKTGLDENQIISLQEKILRRYGFVRFHDLISTESFERQYVHMSGFAFVALPNLICISESTQATVAPIEGHLAPSSPSLLSTNERQIFDRSKTGANNTRISNETTTKLQHSSPSDSTNSKAGARPIAQPGKQNMHQAKLAHQETISSPHGEYITRHIDGARQNKTNRLRSSNLESVEFIWSWNYMLTKRWRSSSTQDESYAVSLMRDFKSFCANGDNRLVEFWNELCTSGGSVC